MFFLYIHIPFCESKCKYCRFASTGKLQDIQIAKYVDFISTPPPTPPLTGEGSINYKSIYFGGGTPGVLSLSQLKKILSNYNYSKETEITLETTPNKITKENLIGWQALGINRISMGVQSLNDDTLKEIGREDKGDIIKALDEINQSILYNYRSPHPNPQSPLPNPPPGGEGTGKINKIPLPNPPLTGEGTGKININKTIILSPVKGKMSEGQIGVINNISIDFIIGLPYVKKGGVKKDIEYILDKYDFITHVSVYMLEKIDSPSPGGEGVRGGGYPGNWQESSIEEEDYLGEYIEVKNFLEKKGFNRYEISNFAKHGYECKHNMAYWNHSEVKAIGLSASGYENGERYTFSSKFNDFYEKNGIFKEKLTKSDIFIEKVMFGLRTSGINEEIYLNLNKQKLDNFIKEKLFFIQNKKLKLTDKGILVLDYIMGEII